MKQTLERTETESRVGRLDGVKAGMGIWGMERSRAAISFAVYGEGIRKVLLTEGEEFWIDGVVAYSYWDHKNRIKLKF